jgi:hypothetical protein
VEKRLGLPLADKCKAAHRGYVMALLLPKALRGGVLNALLVERSKLRWSALDARFAAEA